MSIDEVSLLVWLALTFQQEFNFNGYLNIAGVSEKLDFVCAFVRRVGRHGKKTDILDLFWRFNVSDIGHRVKYGLDHFLDHVLDHFIGGKHTISTQGGGGCSLLVLREGWKAECYYSGRGERRTIARQGEVRGGCNSKHYLLMELLLDRTNYLHRFFDWLFECSSFLSSCESETAT